MGRTMSLTEAPYNPTMSLPLIDSLLAEQQRLSAVDRFSRVQEAQSEDGPALARYYRDLLPLTPPAANQQYAFTVDLDACSGCKACVTACHSLNGLDDSETFRDVGALTGRDAGGLHVLQHVTTACHHCVEPACLEGCPTLAYDKDPQTGIVRHLDDQCIGCQYCTLMCPYDVPKYNPARGIVRKCDMCRQRLVDGEAPACVQACPNQAIRIELVDLSTARERAAHRDFLPIAPDPQRTVPTTRYISSRGVLRDVEAAGETLRAEHAHLPLAVMLVLTQMSLGMFGAALVTFSWGVDVTWLVFTAAAVGVVGQQAAIMHLGRPLWGWKAWMGWRRSWLSREIIAFGAYSGVAGIGVVQFAWHWFQGTPVGTGGGLTLVAACLLGAVAVACSAMIYVATQREIWSAARTIPRFFLTAGLLGVAGAAAMPMVVNGAAPPVWLPSALLVLTLVRLAQDVKVLQHREQGSEGEVSPLARSAELLRGPLQDWHLAQGLAAIGGGLLVPLCAFAGFSAPWLSVVSLLSLIAAELIQRGLFFAAAAPPRMPGVNHA